MKKGIYFIYSCKKDLTVEEAKEVMEKVAKEVEPKKEKK